MNSRNEKAPGRTTEGLQQTNLYRQQYILPVARRKWPRPIALSQAFAEALALAARSSWPPHVAPQPQVVTYAPPSWCVNFRRPL